MYDLIIIGGGPAGLSASLYAGRSGLSCVIFEKMFFGGQMLKTYEIDNYPGAPEIRDVYAFTESMRNQAESFGAEFKTENVVSISEKNGIKTIVTDSGTYTANAVIIATGAHPKKLDVLGEDEFSGKGVSYCATCDGAFFKNKTVAVVGGGDTALEDALFLAEICEKVYLIHRRDEFRASKHLIDRASKKENISFVFDSVVSEILGDSRVSGIKVKNAKDDTESFLKTEGVFIAVGTMPESSLFEGFVEMDSYGYILTNEKLESSVSGVFVAGDVRQKALRQIITATADGAECAVNAQRYILEK